MSNRLPKIKNDSATKTILNKDISKYISKETFSRFSFEFSNKNKSITLRVSSELLEAVQGLAKNKRMPYQRVIREAIEKYLKEAA